MFEVSSYEKYFGLTSTRCRICDDGNGCFEPETAQGMGWHNVQERVAGMNGVVDVTSRPGEGTEVSIVLPACK